MRPSLIGTLADGPLDIIGDVHGEIDALRTVLELLGYAGDGSHPDGRRVVFVGDLIDRGPDSPEVLRTVLRLVQNGHAQCVLGNHDMNALRDQAHVGRAGEGWWYGRQDEGYDSRMVNPDEKHGVFLPWLRSLPLALERDDLRVVHACWHADSVAAVRASTEPDARGLFERIDEQTAPALEDLRLASEAAKRGHILQRHEPPVPYLEPVGHYNEQKVMGHPVRVLTGGMERRAGDAFYASGKWRFAQRVAWWHEYQGPPVVVGHFWRTRDTPAPASSLLAETHAADWLGGPRGHVTCVDYSVGRRFLDRRRGGDGFTTHLAALRVPEWELVFDDGESLAMRPPGTN